MVSIVPYRRPSLMIVASASQKTDCETGGSFYSTSQDCRISAGAGGVEAEVGEVLLALGHHLAVHRVALDQSEMSTVAE